MDAWYSGAAMNVEKEIDGSAGRKEGNWNTTEPLPLTRASTLQCLTNRPLRPFRQILVDIHLGWGSTARGARTLVPISKTLWESTQYSLFFFIWSNNTFHLSGCPKNRINAFWHWWYFWDIQLDEIVFKAYYKNTITVDYRRKNISQYQCIVRYAVCTIFLYILKEDPCFCIMVTTGHTKWVFITFVQERVVKGYDVRQKITFVLRLY